MHTPAGLPRRPVLAKLLLAAGATVTGAGTAACAPPDRYGTAGPRIVLGFSQVGAESGWRTANTISIHDSAGKAGVRLRFSDANGKQENQIIALRSFVQQKVDVIAFSPVVESGWDDVLKQARDAGIPVLLTDRGIETKTPGLYLSLVGSDFVKEGRLAGEWLLQAFQGSTKPVHIAELQGTTGSAPATDRAAGFRAALGADTRFKIVTSQSGEFTRAKGQLVMAAMLAARRDIDVVFAHNDDMGLGAITAMEAAGVRPGLDIRIVTIDAIRDGMKALSVGKINYIVECSPLLGPQLMDLVKKVVNHQQVPDRIVTDETTFTPQQAVAALPQRRY